MREILQIVPLLPPPFEGLGGYALALGQEAISSHGIQSRYIVGSPSWRGVSNGTRAVRERSRIGLAEALAGMSAAVGDKPAAVLLHYVNYGYQKRGCPAWLLGGLARWRGQDSSLKLVTVFHELYAFGPPWSSSFWLSPVQRYLAARLARLSDGIVTSLESYAGALRRWRPDRPACVLPVFSPVGEPDRVVSLSDRESLLVTFGGPGPRARAYGPYRADLERCCRMLGIETVIDIGPRIPTTPAAVGGRPVQALGVLPAGEVSSWLRRARAGFIAYPPWFLGKSTVFAAYAAHGVVPIVAWSRARYDESALRGRHYILSGNLSGEAMAGAADVGANAKAWYQDHSLSKQAAVLVRLLTSESVRP